MCSGGPVRCETKPNVRTRYPEDNASTRLPGAAGCDVRRVQRPLQPPARSDCADRGDQTHEHILPESERTRQRVDFFTLAGHYAIDDLSSSGLPAADRALLEKPDVPTAKKWSVFEPYWRYVRRTGYGEALRIAIRDIYGTEDINTSTIERTNEAIAVRNKPGLYREVLKKRSRIRYAINDEYWQIKPAAVDPEFFLMAKKFDWFVTPITPAGLHRLEALADVSITNLDGLKRAMEKHFLLAVKLGMVTVKSTLAYQRDLLFEETTTAEASADFEKLARGEGVQPDERTARTSTVSDAVEPHVSPPG